MGLLEEASIAAEGYGDVAVAALIELNFGEGSNEMSLLDSDTVVELSGSEVV